MDEGNRQQLTKLWDAKERFVRATLIPLDEKECDSWTELEKVINDMTMNVRGATRPQEDVDLIERARDIYVRPGTQEDIEVDDDAGFSHGEDGSWVQAWVWVPKEEEG